VLHSMTSVFAGFCEERHSAPVWAVEIPREEGAPLTRYAEGTASLSEADGMPSGQVAGLP
jgi:hypothetical protein